MFTTRSTHRPAVVSVLACALLVAAAPVAAAQPGDVVLQKSAVAVPTQAQQKQDLRTPDSRDTAVKIRHAAVNAPGATAVDSASQRPLPGPPTWPVNPQPIKPAPVVHVSDGGLAGTTIGFGIAGGLLLVAGIAGAAVHSRRLGRARIAA